MRAFSLLEVMAVVAVAGVLAALAVPNLTQLSENYRARESVRGAQFALATARNEAQQDNRAVRVDVFRRRVVIQVPETVNAVGLLKQVVTWRELRTFALDLDVDAVTTPAGTTALRDTTTSATLYMCASSDAAWLDVRLAPLCPLGDLASGGGPTVLSLLRGHVTAQLELLPALANIRVR